MSRYNPDLGNPGCFRIDEEVIRRHPHVMRAIFRSFIPRDITHEFYVNTLVYHGWSPSFDPLAEGDLVPFYDAVITESEDGAVTVNWSRHDEEADERASRVRYSPPTRQQRSIVYRREFSFDV